jgi:hypothetical protein
LFSNKIPILFASPKGVTVLNWINFMPLSSKIRVFFI